MKSFNEPHFQTCNHDLLLLYHDVEAASFPCGKHEAADN